MRASAGLLIAVTAVTAGHAAPPLPPPIQVLVPNTQARHPPATGDLTALMQSGAPMHTGAGAAPCRQSPDARAVTLDQALGHALCHHPLTRQTWSAWQAASAERAWWNGPARPSVDARVGVDWLRRSERYPGEPPDRAAGLAGEASLSLDWVLHDFGQRQAQRQMAQAALQSASAAHQEAIAEVLLATAEAWHAVAQSEAELVLLAESERYMRELLLGLLHPASRRSRLGPIDERQARTSLSERSLDVRRGQAEAARARGALAVMLGLAPQSPLTVTPTDSAADVPEFEPALEALMAEAMARHPSLQRARAAVTEADAAVASADRTGRPVLRAGALLSREHDRPTLRTSERRVGLSLEIPLFSGADRQRELTQARSRLVQAQAEVEHSERIRSANVWALYQQVREELAAIRLATRWEAEAFALLRSEVEAFHTQDADMFDVLDAHDTLLEARTAMAEAQTAFSLARFRLSIELGRLPTPLASAR